MKENVALLIQNWDYEILRLCGDEYKESEEIMNKGIRTFYRNTTLFLFLYEYWKQSHISYFDLILRQDLRKFRRKNLNLNVIKWSLVWSRGKISRRERDKSIAVLAEPWFASIERRNWVPPLPSSSPSSPCQPWFSPPPTPLTPATTTTSRPPPRSCRSRSRSRSAPQLLGGSFDPAPPLVAGGGAAPLCQSCAEPQEE